MGYPIADSCLTGVCDDRKVGGNDDSHVVVNVQKRYLVVLFAQHKENGLDEVR